MPRITQKLNKALQSGALRTVVTSLATLGRNLLGRLILASLAIWFAGSFLLYLVEHRQNPDYQSPFDAFWNVWLLLFSGVQDPPRSIPGRMLAMVFTIVGVGLVSFFTAVVASLLVEKYLRRREVTEFQMSDHLIICNWAPRGLEWIRQVHSRIIQQKRAVVIIHDRPEEIDLPDKLEEAAFNDVYIVKGEPSNEVVLNRAKVADAFSVVVLADDREGKHADGKTIVTCVAIRAACRGDRQPNISVECRIPTNRKHLKRAGADEIISSEDLGLRLLARSSLFHGMTQFYQELLTVKRDANEIYLVPAPGSLQGKLFADLLNLFSQNRDDKRSCLLLGIQRGDEMMLNPIGGEAGPLREEDQLILLSRVYPEIEEILPPEPTSSA